MSSVQATRLRKGNLVKHNGDLCRVVEQQHVTPGNLRGFVRAKLRKVKDGSMFEHRFRSEDMVERAALDERQMQYLYKDGGDYYFMDTDNYEQISLSHAELEDQLPYMQPSSEVMLQLVDGRPAGVDLPASVELAIVDTEPGVKGDTVSNVTKPATLETGAVVQVPLFVNVGDRIKVDTREARYISRA